MRIFLFVFFLLFQVGLIAQEVNDEIIIVPYEGENYKGKLVSITEKIVYLEIDGEEFGIDRELIKEMFSAIYQHSKITNESEPYYVPSARTNGAGSHYYKNYYLLANNVGFGVSDNVELGFGIEGFSIIAGEPLPVIQVSGKVVTNWEGNFDMGIYTRVAFNNEGGVLFGGVPFTIGGKRTNITLAPTLAYPIDDFDEGQVFLFTNLNIGITSKSRIVFDGLFTSEGLGGALLLEVTFNNGFTIMPGVAFIEELTLIPNLAFSIPFGKWKKKI